MKSLSSTIKAAVVTATRAEYGLLTPLLNRIVDDRDLELVLIVAGAHLSREFGYTRDAISQDFKIHEQVECLVSNDTPSAVGKTAGLALMGFVDAFERQSPDIVVVLGDRYEMLCASFAASLCRLPIAHIHGGEISEGAYDDGFRHAISKLSHLHFTSSERHRERVIQLGEDSGRVHNVGALGIDCIKTVELLDRSVLETELGIRFQKHILLVTVHPETLNPGSSERNARMISECLDEFPDMSVVFTGANADSEGRIINEIFKDSASHNPNRLFVLSLGQVRYLSLLTQVDAVVGNSSSGLIEVPFFGKPTINVGDRQKGRQRCQSVVDVNWIRSDIIGALERVVINGDWTSDGEFPFGDGEASESIVRILKNQEYGISMLKKSFCDIT